MLRAIGCQVQIANNGWEVFQAFEQDEYDLILMDCHMPEMDGFQATTAIRQSEKTANKRVGIPIVALTADVQKGITEHCMNAGMNGYLSKPFNKKQLQETLEKWLPTSECDLGNTKTVVTPNTPSLLNADALDNLRSLTTATGDSLLNKAIELFVDSAEKTISQLRTALANHDANSLTTTAHSFKSGCANLGADNLANCAAAIEALAKAGQLNGVDVLLTTMATELPLVLAALNDEVVPLSTDQPIQQTAANMQKHRILLVDDDLSFRLVSREALRAAGFIVDEAVSGRQALEKIKQQIPDLVLLDAVMEEDLDGFKTCELLRAEASMMDTPIVMSTGLGDIDSINRAFDAGATDFIVKPLNYPIIIHRLHFILRAGHNAAELRSSKTQLTAAQRVARLGYWTWNSENNYFEISAYLAKLCGIELETFAGDLDDFFQLVHSQDRDEVEKFFTEIAQGKSGQEADFRLTVVQADPIFVHQEIDTITECGTPIVIGTVQDITARVYAEAELGIAAIAFESQEGMMITDADSVILRVNHAFTEVTGYTADEVIGKTPQLLKSGRHDKVFYIQMWSCIKRTNSWAGEIYDMRKNGEVYPKWLTITAVKNRQGKVTHYVSSHTDISERKAQEEEIKQLAFYDVLTGLANRRLLFECLKHSIDLERRENIELDRRDNGKQLAVLMLDLDKFKNVNDR